jgi:hypothetical protein
MANRDLLKEAIADAKALKETAIANAKAALEEAFEPRVKEMLSAKLQEMDEELDEVVNEADSDDLEEAKRAEDKETKRTKKMKYGKDLAESDEADLDEILAELDREMEENKDIDEAEEAEEEVDVDMEMEDEEDIDLEEMSEDDLKSFIEDVIKDMVESGELEAGDEFEMEDEESEDEEIEIEDEDETEEIMEGEEVVDEGILGKIKKYIDDSKDAEGKFDSEKFLRFVDKMDKLPAGTASAGMTKSGAGKGPFNTEESIKMDKMEEELNELRTELNEVNLLNAKLLYTNKIFRAKNLMETQKVKVLEAFDKATTVKEVKLVYETLNEGIKEKAPIRENLGSASRPAGVAPKQQIVEVDSQVARWQKLAGITK